MEVQSKRARTDGDQGASQQLVEPAEGSSSAVADSFIDVLPDALLERIFSEHFSAAEAWRTARLACRKWRRLVEEIEWGELQVDGTRPATFRTLAAVVRSGRLRLRGGGAAAVEFDIKYRDVERSSNPDDAPVITARNEELLAEIKVDALGQAAHDALRACMLAAGGLRHVGVSYHIGALSDILLRFEDDMRVAIGRRIAWKDLGALSSLQPPSSSSSSLSSLSIRRRDVEEEEEEEMDEMWQERLWIQRELFLGFGPNGARALRTASSPFSGLKSLIFSFSLFFGREETSAIAASCPALERLHLCPYDEDAFVGLSPLSKLEELRWSSKLCQFSPVRPRLTLGVHFAEFAASPAGQNLRILGDAWKGPAAGDKNHGHGDSSQRMRPSAACALPAMRSLERLLFTEGIEVSDGPIDFGDAREAVACIGACEKLTELSFICKNTSAGFGAETAVLNGLADALGRSKSLRHLDLSFLMDNEPYEPWPASSENWGPYREAMGRLLAAAAPVLRSAVVAFTGMDDGDYGDTLHDRQACLWESLRAAGPLGAELAGPAPVVQMATVTELRWSRAESAALTPMPQ
eukprot:tig00021257_g19761.t1